MTKCLYCYEPLENGEKDFHRRCARRIFKSDEAPELSYSRYEIGHLAKEVIRSQTTLTGVQAKLSLDLIPADETGCRRFTIVGLWGRFILKPQTDIFRNLPEVEDLTMHLAEAAKIAVVPHTLMRFADGEICYITRRIDRTDNGAKLPMEDMCQLTERLTEYKYRGSHEQIAKAIGRYSAAPLLDLTNYWELTVFSWITGNADMHLKNYSLYAPRNDKGYILTPCYDLVSTALVMPGDKDELALTLNGKNRKIKKSDFEKVMAASGLDTKSISNIFKKMLSCREKWNQWIDKSFLPDDMKTSYKEIIEQKLDKLE